MIGEAVRSCHGAVGARRLPRQDEEISIRRRRHAAQPFRAFIRRLRAAHDDAPLRYAYLSAVVRKARPHKGVIAPVRVARDERIPDNGGVIRRVASVHHGKRVYPRRGHGLRLRGNAVLAGRVRHGLKRRLRHGAGIIAELRESEAVRRTFRAAGGKQQRRRGEYHHKPSFHIVTPLPV